LNKNSKRSKKDSYYLPVAIIIATSVDAVVSTHAYGNIILKNLFKVCNGKS